MRIHVFTYNAFAENTYVVSNDDTGTCVIIDPGASDSSEFQQLKAYLSEAKLKPQKVVLTHAHIDHVLGLKRCLDAYNLEFYMNDNEQQVLNACPAVASMYGMNFEAAGKAHVSLDEENIIEMGGLEWTILFTPGHSPGSLCYYQQESGILIGGDVLFRDSIGRTDLPGGNHTTLLNSITTKLYSLPEEIQVYPGHGPSTTIGYEKKNNPFVRG